MKKRVKRKTVKKVAYTTGAFVEKLPDWAASRVAETIIKHARLEWILSKVVFNLMEISIKRGRIFFRLSPSAQYVSQLRQHLALSKIRLKGFKFTKLESELRAAAAARNALAHSVYVRDSKGHIRIQLVTGSWGVDSQKYEPVYRAINPETPVVTRAYLLRQRKAVNAALRRAKSLQRAVNRALFVLQRKRRTVPTLERRNKGGSLNELRNLMYPPQR